MRRQFAEWAKNTLKSNNELVVLLGDISVGLFVDNEDTLPDRCYNLGILEQAMTSFAAGLSASGLKPFVHTISPFLIERSLEQIKLDILYNKRGVTLVAANSPFEYSKLGPTHHCPNDVPLLTLLGDFDIFLPAFKDEVPLMLDACLASADNANYVRLHSYSSPNDLSWQIPPDTIVSLRHETESYLRRKDRLTVLVGESLNLMAKQSQFDQFIEARQNIVYINRLPIASTLRKEILDYEHILIYEPYSAPVLSNILSEENIKSVIESFCYPNKIETGIFSAPFFIKS